MPELFFPLQPLAHAFLYEGNVVGEDQGFVVFMIQFVLPITEDLQETGIYIFKDAGLNEVDPDQGAFGQIPERSFRFHKPFLGIFALGYIVESNDGADDSAVLTDGGTGIFDGESGPVLSAKALVLDAARRTGQKCRVRPAFFLGIGRSIGPRVIYAGMAVPADQLSGLIAEHGGGGFVHERIFALHIQPEDAFPGGFQDELVPPAQLFELFFRSFQLLDLLLQAGIIALPDGTLSEPDYLLPQSARFLGLVRALAHRSPLSRVE